MDPDAHRSILHRDDDGLDEDPLIRQQERASDYYHDFLEKRRDQETFRSYLQRRIGYAYQRMKFPPPVGGPGAKKEHDRMVQSFKRLYGAQAFIRYWRSNPPPPNHDR